MWICSKFGFFSVVQKAPDEFHVRARCRADLANLLKRASESEALCFWVRTYKLKILRTAPADYRFRIVLTCAQWTALAPVFFESVDYANFKGVIANTANQADKLSAYSAFHHDMEDWQEGQNRQLRSPDESMRLF